MADGNSPGHLSCNSNFQSFSNEWWIHAQLFTELEYHQIRQLSMLSTTNLPGQCSNFLVFMLKHAWSIPPMIILSLYLMILCTRHAIKRPPAKQKSPMMRCLLICSLQAFILSTARQFKCQLEVESLRSMTPNRVFTSNHGKTCRSLGVSNMASGSSVEVIRKSTWARPSKTLPGHYKLPTSSNRLHLTSDGNVHLFMKRWPMVSSLNSTSHINSLQQLCVGIANAGGICHSFLNCHLGVLTLAIVHLLKDNIRPQTSDF